MEKWLMSIVAATYCLDGVFRRSLWLHWPHLDCDVVHPWDDAFPSWDTLVTPCPFPDGPNWQLVRLLPFQ